MARDVDPRRLFAAHAAAAEFYRARLPGHLPALAYLHSRGVSEAVAHPPPWTVGYAPAGWTELRTALHAAGFLDRVMFPVRRRDGLVVGFTGRDLSGRSETPKYRNTVTTAIYRKKRVLY